MWRAITVFALLLGGCAHSEVIPLSADTVQITSAAAPMCGMTGAQRVALQRAAVETINRGYDRFVITNGAYHNNVRVVGHTPVIAQSSGTAYGHVYGNSATINTASTTTVTGGQPITGGTHNQALIVKMFRDGDPLGSNAISARAELGPEWKEIAANGSVTCLPS